MPGSVPAANNVRPDTNKQDFLRILSANTGGRAMTSNNAAAAEVISILRENQSYYDVHVSARTGAGVEGELFGDVTVPDFKAQGGALIPIAVSATVLDAHEKKVFESKETLLQDPFKVGVGEYRLNLPVSTLPPGSYVLRIDATRGSVTAERTVRFTVK